MFRPIDVTAAEQRQTVVIQVEGRDLEVLEGQTLASALLGAGVVPFRQTPVSGAPRAPLCLMGVCFDCLLEVDGQHNVQSCLLEVRSGMRVQLPTGARKAACGGPA